MNLYIHIWVVKSRNAPGFCSLVTTSLGPRPKQPDHFQDLCLVWDWAKVTIIHILANWLP